VSGEFEDFDEGQADELVGEDWPTFFTMVPVWLLLAGCSAQAYRMYAFLAEHISQVRTSNQPIACPKQIAIARVLGLSSDRKVARYREELVALGALRVEKYRYANGMRTGYRYFIRFNAPTAFDGPRSLSEFYNANPDVRSAKADGRTRAAKSPDQAPAAVEASRAVAAQSAPGPAAASPKPAATKPKKSAPKKGGPVTLPPQVLQVLAAFPPALREAMKETAHTDSPKTLVNAVTKALQGRTAEQLVDRVSRRWWLHGYEAKFEAGELLRPVGAAVAMLRHGECPDQQCEDGRGADGEPCRLCVERGKDYKADWAAARRAQKEAAEAAARSRFCPGCERDRGTEGALCVDCTGSFERSVLAAADRAAAEAALEPGALPEHAEQARDRALGAAREAAEEARLRGGSDLGRLLAAQGAADGVARQIHRRRLEMLPAGQDLMPIPAQAPAPEQLEPVPCQGQRLDGSPCLRPTDEGLCGRCRAAQRDQARAQELAPAQ